MNNKKQVWPEGRTIKKVRPMTTEEIEREGWDTPRDEPIALELDDDSIIYPSQDEEGNGPGALFGINPAGKSVILFIGGAA